jgi:hypothetical protein
MDKVIKEWLATLKGAYKALDADEIEAFLRQSKKSSNEFIKRQGEKLILYTRQLAEGSITVKQYESYVEDVRILTEMHALQLKGRARDAAHSFSKKAAEYLIKQIVAAVMKAI